MSILRRICDAADEQDWVKVAFKIANDKVAEAKVVLDELGYTAYDVEGAMDDDKTIKVSTQHPDETKAKILPKFKQAGITPISTRVTDSNKRLDEYILGSLRKNGIESAVNIEQHKDGFRVSLQGNTDVYLDIYLDGENVVVRGFAPDAIVNVSRYAKFAGIPEEQAKQVIRKVEKWAKEVNKLDAKPVAELESVRITDDAKRSMANLVREALNETGTADLFEVVPGSNSETLKSKESDTYLTIREIGTSGKFHVFYSGEVTPPKVKALIKLLRERLAVGKVGDSVEDLKLPKFSSNAKLNKLCTILAEEILAHFTEDSTETMLSELERYKREFPREFGYNFLQYGNTSIISYHDAKETLHDAGYSTKLSDTAAWEAVCRTMCQVIRALLDHKEELLKQKVTDAVSSQSRFLDGADYIEIEDIVKKHFPGAKVNAYRGDPGEVSTKVHVRGNRISDVYGDFALTWDGRIIRKHGEDKLREMGDFDAMVEELVAKNPYKKYEKEIREMMNGTTRIYDSTKIKTASLREALKRAGKLTDDAGAEPSSPDDVLEQIKRYGADSLYVESDDDGEIEITDPESGVDAGVVVRVDKGTGKLKVSIAPGAPKHIAKLGNFLRDRVAGRPADVAAWESLSDDDLTSKVMDSATSRSSEDVVKDAIAKAKLRVPAKMRTALMRLAKRKTPIKSVKFGQESHPSAVHNKDAYDFAEVFYEHTASSKHATVAWDGEVTGALN